MDLVFLMIDAFHRAGKLVQGIDIEFEAITESWLGQICFHLKWEQKAKKHLYSCLWLAQTLAPKNVTREDWHKKASKYLKEV